MLNKQKWAIVTVLLVSVVVSLQRKYYYGIKEYKRIKSVSQAFQSAIEISFLKLSISCYGRPT